MSTKRISSTVSAPSGYLRSYPSLERRFHQLSSNGGVQPLWSPSGREVLYIEPGSPSRMMRVPLGESRDETPGRPEPLLEWPYRIGERPHL